MAVRGLKGFACAVLLALSGCFSADLQFSTLDGGPTSNQVTTLPSGTPSNGNGPGSGAPLQITGPNSAAESVCSGPFIASINASGAVGGTYSLAVFQPQGSQGQVYSDASCLTPVANVQLSSNQPTAQFYYKGWAVSQVTFQVSGPFGMGAQYQVQVTPSSAFSSVSLLAGNYSPAGKVDATGSAALFNNPYGIATDGSFAYVSDMNNQVIRRIDLASHAVVTIAGGGTNWNQPDGVGTAATLNSPAGLALLGSALYIADGSTIRKLDLPSGTVSTLAGQRGIQGAQDGTGATATFSNDMDGLATDGTYLYAADTYNNKIRKIDPATGAVTTFAGSAYSSYDGTGTGAAFEQPRGIVYAGGALYVTDSNNGTIRKITVPGAVVTTFAGLAGDPNHYVTGVSGSLARFNQPVGITTDGSNLFVADRFNGKVRQIRLSDSFTTDLAGGFGSGGVDGPSGSAIFGNSMTGIAAYGTGSGEAILVADSTNDVVRSISYMTGYVSTIAGPIGRLGFANGTGTAAAFNQVAGIVRLGGNLYVADAGNGALRQISIATGAVTTAVSGLNGPEGVATDGVNLYVSQAMQNNILRIAPSGWTITAIAGATGISNFGFLNGVTGNVMFRHPSGMTVVGSTLYVSDRFNHVIRAVDLGTLNVTTLAGMPPGPGLNGATFPGFANGTAGAAQFNSPIGLASDGSNLYVADNSNAAIRVVSLSSGQVSTLTGGPSGANNGNAVDGDVAQAAFSQPTGISTDGSAVYFADALFGTIRMVNLSTNKVSTIAGFPWKNLDTDGPNSVATLSQPTGVDLGSDGTVFFANPYNVRAIAPAAPANPAPPTLTSISPTHGLSKGGTTVTIIGSGFHVGASFTIGGAICTTPTYQSAAQVTCQTTGHPSGNFDVVVRNPDGGIGTGAGLYHYDAPAQLLISDGPTYNFGTTYVGSGITHTFTVTNVGDLTASSFSVGQSSGYHHVMGGTCWTGGTAAGGGGTCTLTISWRPGAAGVDTGDWFNIGYQDGAGNFASTTLNTTGTGNPLPSGIVFWYRASSVLNQGNVSSWADNSGNGNNATQGVLASQPSMVDQVINGWPVLRFSGSKFLSIPLISMSLTSGFDYFVVLTPQATSQMTQMRLTGSGPTNLTWFTTSSGYYGYNQNGSQNGNNGYYTSGVTTAFEEQGSSTNGGVTPYFMSAGAWVSTTSGALSMPSAASYSGYIGDDGSGTTYFNGDIAEIIFYSRPLSPSERSTMQSYISSKYGL